MKIMYIDLIRYYKRTHFNFFVLLKCMDTVYFRLKCNEKSNSVAFQANIIFEKITMYDNYNVTTWPMKTITT